MPEEEFEHVLYEVHSVMLVHNIYSIWSKLHVITCFQMALLWSQIQDSFLTNNSEVN